MERARILLVVTAVVVAVVAAVAVFLLRGGGDRLPDAPGVRSADRPDAVPEAAEGRVDVAPTGRREVGGEGAAATVDPVRGSGDTALVVRLVWSTSDEPVPGAEVFTYRSQSQPWVTKTVASTDDAGIAHFAELAPGGWYVESVFGGRRAGVDLVLEETVEITLRVAAGASVEGLVVDAVDRPIPGAFVWLSEAWDDGHGGVAARTDAVGAFTIRGVRRGSTVAAWAEGYAASAVHPVRGKPGERTILRLALSRTTGSVTGVVSDAAGRPIADAVVVVGAEDRPFDRRAGDGTRLRGPAPREVRADVRGRFVARHLEPGLVPFEVAAEGYAPAGGAVEVHAGEEAETSMTLLSGGVVEGVCRDGSGETLAGVRVATVGASRLASRGTQSDVDGRYRLADVSIGEVEVAASQGGGAAPPVTATVVTRPGGPVRWDPVLAHELVDPAQLVSGRVVGVDGRGLDSYRVVAEPDPPERATPVSRVTVSDGRFQLAVPWERVRLYVYASSGAPGFPVAHAGGVARGTQDVELRVDEAALSGLRARIVDTTGQPVDATLQVWHTDARVWREVAAQAGTGVVELRPMLPGKCTLEVRSSDHPWLRLGERALPAGGELDLGDLVLQPGGHVEGRVAFVDGGLPTKLSLRFVEEAVGREVGVAEVRDGRYRSSPLPLGKLLMVVEGDGVAATRLPIALDAATPLRVVDLSVERGVQVTLRIAPAPGTERPAWMSVGVFREREPVWSHGVGQSAGLEITTWLAPGSYRVLVQAGEPLADVAFEVRGQPLTVDVPLRAK